MQSDSRSNLVSVLIKFSVNLVTMLACKMGVTNRDNHFRFINMTLMVNNGYLTPVVITQKTAL